MSLKAKLEAVIYAAEEPVTLAQLAMLFANEALEWKAEQQAAAQAAQDAQNADLSEAEPAELPLAVAEPFGVEAEPLGIEDELLAVEIEPVAVEEEPLAPEEGTLDEAAADEPPPTATEETPSGTAVEEESAAEGESNGLEPAADMAPQAEQDPAAVEVEARRAARQREREVRTILREVLDEIIASYASDGRGLEIREIAGGYRMATKPECHDAVRMFVKSLKPPLKLSLPALETLAVIAYKQPVTAPEVNEIRGVDSSGVFGSLLARKLIATAGRKQVIGRPILYKTTKEFLLRFGLKDIAELPSMEEFEKMAASELEDVEPASETTAANVAEKPTSELDESASEDTAEPAAAAATPEADAEPPQAEMESNPPEAPEAPEGPGAEQLNPESNGE